MKRNIALVDFTNIAKICLFTPHVRLTDTHVDYDMWRWTVWNKLYYALYRVRATGCVLACDASSWRKLVYKVYKLNRKLKKDQELANGKKDLNWEEFYAEMNKFLEMLQANLPFQIIKIDKCEADDIIGVLALNIPFHQLTIISSDQDFQQVLNDSRIKLYCPIKKEYRKCKDTERYLLDCSLKGQGKDNIYNVFTNFDHPILPVEYPDGSFKTIRKPPLGIKKIDKILNDIGLDQWLDIDGPEECKKKNIKLEEENKKLLEAGLPTKPLLNTNLRERFELNRKVMDFREVPKVLKDRILDKYHAYEHPDPNLIYPFFQKMNWPQMLERFTQVEDFLMRMY